MRLVGKFDEREQGQVFSDFLCVQEMENELRSGKEGWGVWVLDSKQLDKAKEWLALYRENPDAPEFQGVGSEAKKIRQEVQKDKEDFSRQVYDRESLFGSAGMGKLTIVLIGACVVVALFSQLGKNRTFLNYLFITKTEVVGNYIRWHRGLPDIFRLGEVWRLVTPIFIHFGILHLLFNMLWLKDLGSMVENRQKAWFLGLFVVVIGVASNLAQFAVSGPNFGGMSGVVYGLLGYTWIRGRYDPGSGFHIRKEIVYMMMIWFFVCLSGIIGNIANTAHGVGLVGGMLWGYLSAQWVMRKHRR